jgi:osmoprotectant transport system substrate-binding protein
VPAVCSARLVPIAPAGRDVNLGSEDPMRNIRMLALGASLLVLASACTTGGGSPTPATASQTTSATTAATTTAAGPPEIRIGSAGFYESQLMGELYAQVLEAHGYTVDRKFGLGERPATETAFQGGQIDLKPEYIGSYLEFLNKGKGEASGDPAATAAKLDGYLTALHVTRLGYTPGQDQNGFAVTQETADANSLTDLTSLAAVAGKFIVGVAPACVTNPLCIPGLKATYGITFKEVKTLGACSPDGVTALTNKVIQVYEVCTTQPGVSQFSLVVLADDKRLQPADNLAPVVRDDYLAKLGDPDGFKVLLNQLSAGLDTPTLLALGVKIDVDKKDIDQVAKEYLQSRGLVP